MSGSKGSQKVTFRLTVKLDYEQDAEIIQWLEAQPARQRSEAVRKVLREHISSSEEPVVKVIRTVIAEELNKALDGYSADTLSHGEQGAQDIEQRFGDRLDQMLGGLDQDDHG
jgi:hypothetical protein